MKKVQLAQLLLDQNNDLFWMIDADFRLIYANNTYLNLIRAVTGVEQKLNETVLLEGLGKENTEKWKSYYRKAFEGTNFEIEDHLYHTALNVTQYSQITFKPVTGNDENIFAVACQSRDIPVTAKNRSDANQMIDASLDVFCTINEQGNFVYVSAAAATHWGYLPRELIGKAYMELLLDEDVPKTKEIAAAILSGREIKSFVNRYKKKDEGIAYNLWSARWDDDAKIMYCVARDCKEQIEQEEKILQSEQRFKALLQGSADMIGILDVKGNYSYVSSSVFANHGFKQEEFIGKNGIELLHPDDVQRVEGSMQKLATENRVKLDPIRLKNSNNEWRWIEAEFTNMLNNPAVNGIVVNSRDITDKIEEKNKLKSVSAIAKIGYWRLELERKALSWTDEVYAIWGRQKDSFDVNYENFLNTIHPADLILFEKDYALAYQSLAPIDHILRISLPGNQIRWVHELGRLVTDEDGKAIAFEGTVQDITQQKEEEQRLKLLESVITNTNDAILITEAEPFDELGNRIIYVNEAFTKMTGYAAEEIIGKTPRILQGPNSNTEELAELGRKIRNWQPCELTTINYKKNGEEFWVNFALTPVADEKGRYIHWISIERDVTGQKTKELENELLAQINTSFNAENDYVNAANAICKSICKYGKFDLVEVWTANLEKTHMQLFTHYVPAPEDEKFYAFSQHVDTFKMSESLVGKVWLQRKHLLWDDIENNKDFLRRDEAKKIGLKAVLGIPLIFNDDAVGVLKIGTKQDANYLKKYTQLFKRLETFIGSELNRKKLESDLSHFFNAIPDILCLLDFKGRFLKMNKAGCELLGYSEEEVLYQRFDEFVHPLDRGIFTNEVFKIERRETTFKFENRYITKTGNIIWLSWFCNATLNEDIIYATAKNVTEEKKLRELNRQVNSMAKIGSWELDLVNRSLFWSDQVHQLHETDPKSFVPDLEAGINFYREDFRQIVQLNIEKSITSGESFDFEAVVVTAKKKELWVRVLGHAEFADGKCKRIYGSFQDINSLKESENRLRLLSENLPGVVYQYLIHPDGTDSLSYVSGAVEQVWGFTASEVIENISLVWNQIKAGGDLEEAKASMLKSVQAKSKWTSRTKYVMPSGELHIHISNGTPVFLSDGTIIYNSITLDITQEVKKDELLTQAGEMARIGSWEMDLINQNGDRMYWSPLIREILEVDDTYDTKLTGGFEFYTGESSARIKKATDALINEGVKFDEELLLKSAKGNERWIRVIGKSERVESRCIKIYGSFQDIDERKKSEMKLAESENRFRSILKAEPECIKLLGPGGEVLMMNPAGLRMIEADNEEQVIGKSVLDIVIPEHRVAFANLTKTIFKGDSGKLEFEIKGFKGSRRWWETHAVPLKNEQGDILSLLGVTRDITDRKKSEEDIKDSEEKRRLIMNGALDAIICIDTDGNITFWNPQAEILFGWKESEVIGQQLSELILPEQFRSHHNAGIKHYNETGEGKVLNLLLELTAIRRSGEEFPIELTVLPIKQQGKGVFFCSFIRDITQRKKTEDLLDKSNRLARIGNWEADLDKATVYWSPVTWEIHEADAGYEPDLSKDLEFYKEGENRNRITQCVQDCINHGTTWDEELQIVTLKGNLKWIRTIGRGEFRDNKCIRVYGSFQDITERKKAETLLQESENKFRSLIENSGDMLTLISADGKMEYISPSVEKTFGYTNEENKTRQAMEVVHPDDVPVAMNVIENALKTPGVPFTSTIRNRKKDGTYIWVEGTVTNMLHVPGVNAIVANIRDITESKKAEEKILLIHERLQLATHAANVGIWDYHIENNSLIWDENMYKLYGVNPSDFSGAYDAWERGLHPDDLKRAAEELQTTIRGGKKFDTEFRVIWPDKTIHYIKADAVVYRDTVGVPVRLVGTNRDITESKKAEEELIVLNKTLTVHADELKRSNEELEQFAFIASHDLQEPLRMISSFMDQLKRKYGDRLDEKGHQYIDFATDGAKRMKQIILDLLQYSRTNRPTEGKNEVNLNELLSEFKQLRRKLISEKSALIKSNDLPTLNSYKAAITQIFHGILDNALKYSIEDIAPIVEVNAVENEKEWQFSIRDNGIGISPEFYAKIFVIFQRLHNRDQYSGTGIGLSIAKRHVEFLGGRIWLESTPGEGSVFYFTIPKH